MTFADASAAIVPAAMPTSAGVRYTIRAGSIIYRWQ
jgi:hypothetical protein